MIRVALIVSLLSTLCVSANAQTSYPMLMSLKPVAAQVGATSEHTVSSRYSMYGAYDVIVTGKGVTGEIVPSDAKPDDKGNKPSLTKIKVRFHIAADAEPGVRDFRIATPQGVSTLGQLVVVRDPVVSESGKNNTAADANPITIPATVCGAIETAEDVDFFKFHVEAGDEYTFHTRSQRLQDRIHDLQQHVDPILTIRNSSGSTVAASDNYFYGDPFLTHRFEQAGDYFLEIRDVRYQGNAYWEYGIEISQRPFVEIVHPMGLPRGQDRQIELVGSKLPDTSTVTVKAPMDMPLGPGWMPVPMGDELTNPVPVVVSDLPPVVEIDTENDTPETGQKIALPAAISGRIEQESDLDYYTFDAKKGERFSFEVVARRQQSHLDSHLRIVDTSGKQLALNDDLRDGKRTYADSRIENWTAPADGTYALEIRDLHLRGGDGFVYFIEARRALPHFNLYLDTDKTQLTPGTCGVLYVRIERKNGFDSPVQLAVDGLPSGVTATCGRILAGKAQDGCIVFQAFPDARLSASNITVSGTAEIEVDGKLQQVSATAIAYQETYQPGGGRGHWPVSMHTVAVGAPSDLQAVLLSESEITLKPGESKRIDIELIRAEGFDKNVTLDVQFRHLSGVFGDPLPPGVTLDSKNSKTLLTGKTSQGHITLTAAANAEPVENQVITVMANVALNFVMKATYASRPLTITIAK